MGWKIKSKKFKIQNDKSPLDENVRHKDLNKYSKVI